MRWNRGVIRRPPLLKSFAKLWIVSVRYRTSVYEPLFHYYFSYPYAVRIWAIFISVPCPVRNNAREFFPKHKRRSTNEEADINNVAVIPDDEIAQYLKIITLRENDLRLDDFKIDRQTQFNLFFLRGLRKEICRRRGKPHINQSFNLVIHGRTNCDKVSQFTGGPIPADLYRLVAICDGPIYIKCP
jgi:hypothetical protein